MKPNLPWLYAVIVIVNFISESHNECPAKLKIGFRTKAHPMKFKNTMNSFLNRIGALINS